MKICTSILRVDSDCGRSLASVARSNVCLPSRIVPLFGKSLYEKQVVAEQDLKLSKGSSHLKVGVGDEGEGHPRWH